MVRGLSLFLSRFFQAVFVKQIDKINLSLSGYFCRSHDVAFSVRADSGGLLYFHPSGVNASLRGHIVCVAALMQIAIFAEPCEKAVLPDVQPGRLFYELRHFTDKNRRLGYLY